MSSSPTSLTVPGLDAFAFVAAKPAGGFIPTEPEPELEDLTCPGVDYAVARDRGLRFRRWQLDTLAQYPDEAALLGAVAAYQRAKGQLVSLTHTVRGVTRTFAKVRVLDLEPALLPGVMVSDATYLGLRCTWTLELTQKD